MNDSEPENILYGATPPRSLPPDQLQKRKMIGSPFAWEHINQYGEVVKITAEQGCVAVMLSDGTLMVGGVSAAELPVVREYRGANTFYLCNGKLHCEDGPAVIGPNYQHWFLDGAEAAPVAN